MGDVGEGGDAPVLGDALLDGVPEGAQAFIAAVFFSIRDFRSAWFSS
jgi:hypothetical protein